MKYIFLLLTVICESAAVVLMKASAGFTQKISAGAAVACYAASFIFFTLALRNLPAGIANAVWAGAGTVLVALAGVVIFKEQLSGIQIIFLVLIVIGIAGFNFYRG